MIYSTAAGAVVVIHLLFVIFVGLGGFLALRWPRLVWAHLPAAVWGAMIEFQGWTCPLTPLEKRLHEAAGQSGYEGGFIEHYLIPLLYPAGLTRELQLWLGFGVIAINLLAYGLLVWRWHMKLKGES